MEDTKIVLSFCSLVCYKFPNYLLSIYGPSAATLILFIYLFFG